MMAVLAAAMTAASTVALSSAPEAAAEEDVACPWMDTTLSPEQRTRLLLDASTLEQKMRWLVEHPAIRPGDTNFQGVSYPEALPCTPEVQFTDGSYGVQSGFVTATAFPAPIAEASIWDPAITYEKYSLVAREAWGHRRAVILAPGFQGGRNPLLSRTSEYLGEDPVLAGTLGAQGVLALQDDPEIPMIATAKHYVANEHRFQERTSSSNMDERTLRQHYDLPYAITIKEGDPGSIMCSYNGVNGKSMCENPEVLELLDEAGFDGFIMSDFGGVYSTAPSLMAGLDMELNRPVWFTPERLEAALAAGEVTEERIDEAAFNVVRSFIRHGLFDIPRPTQPDDEIITPESLALAQEMAEKGTVLLKNDGVLPLAGEEQTIAVIGRTASNQPTGGVSAVTVCGAHGMAGPGGRVNCDDNVAPLDAITERAAEAGATVVFDSGVDPAAAAQVAGEADVAIVFGYSYTPYQTDYPDLRLLDGGDDLIEAVAAANDRTIVTLQSGTALEMPWIEDVDAVLQAWYLGQQMGPALANLLWGDVNPSGKLPMTFPKSFADTPVASPERYPGILDENGWRQADFSEGLAVGYRWYQSEDIEPLFPFGHGMSYTTFDYSHLRVTPQRTDGEKEIRIRFRVANTGDRVGREISQVYVELPDAAGEPWKRLVGWASVELDPGEHQNVEVTLSSDHLDTRKLLQYWDEATGEWTTPSGTYTVHVGASSDDLSLESTFAVR
jgi:beta-glucosidase